MNSLKVYLYIKKYFILNKNIFFELVLNMNIGFEYSYGFN